MVSGINNDIAIIGGGPAGLSASIALKLKGFNVTVIDYRNPPIKKACGEGILPHGVKALKDLGVEFEDDLCARFSGIRFIDDDLIAEGTFFDVHGVGIKRPDLHDVLRERAHKLGVNLLWNCKIRKIDNSVITLDDNKIEYSYLVGADGASSKTRRLGGFKTDMGEGGRVGLQRHYDISPWSSYVEVYCSQNLQAFVTPVSNERVCVALVGKQPSFDQEYLLERLPNLVDRLSKATHSSEILGGISQSIRLKEVIKNNVVLVGDASFCIDSITGDGLSLAFNQSLALAEAFASGDIHSYNAAHRSLIRQPILMERILIYMSQHSHIRRAAIKALQRNKPILDSLLNTHISNDGSFNLVKNISSAAIGILAG